MIKTLPLLVASLIPIARQTALAQSAGAGNPLEWRFAREMPTQGHTYMRFAYPEGATRQPTAGLYVEDRTMVTLDDFLTIEWSVTATGLDLEVRLKPEAAERLARESEPRLGEYFAALVDSRLVTAAKLTVVIGKNPELPIWIGLPLPQQVAMQTATLLSRLRPRP